MAVLEPGGIPTPRIRGRILVSVCPGHLSLSVIAPLLGASESSRVDPLPPFSWGRAFTDWGLDPYMFVLTVWVCGLYLLGVWTLRSRGDHWPVSRILFFCLGGMGTFFFATSSGIGRYDTTLLSAHMVQHMLITMAAPLLLALGAPITLALRTLPKRGRAVLLVVLHSRVAKVLTFPPLVFAIFVLSPWALYFTDWYEASLRSEYIHEMTHVHLMLTGSLFFWPLAGIDPVPGRVAYPFRVLMVLMTLPFHAFLGITIMDQNTPLAGPFYAPLREGPMGAWLPPMLEDQHLAGGILWATGDLFGLLLFLVLFAQWVRSSMREAAREDRRLDLLEARGR